MDATKAKPAIALRCAAVAAMLLLCLANPLRADFEKGNRLYDAGQFGEAKQEYEMLVANGEWTANLFYNLGNADHRLGAAGRAMLDYERALALEPSHPEAQRNLALLRERSGGRIEPEKWWKAAFPRWRSDSFAILCAVAGWTAVLSFVLRQGSRRKSGVLGAVTLVALTLAAYSGVALWLAERNASLAIITAKEAVARLAPAEQSGIATTLPAGSRVHVRSERGGWIYCELPGEGLGWLPAEVLERIRILR